MPLALLHATPPEAPWRRPHGRIVVLEPRRLAARAAATRMAALLGEPVGRTVGYRTRLDSATSDATRVEVVTEGLMVRRLLADPGLDGTDAVLFDEIHERALDADLALAFCLDLQRELRPELRLLAMSATADGARLSAMLGAGVLDSPGRAHPVATSHAARDLASPRELPERMAAAIRAGLADHPGDLLAFLPGMAEIRRTEQALSGCGAVVLPLHGDLPPAAQDLALRPDADGRRRVVLATSIAETSLTVPGVRIVVDGGWRRAPRLDPATGLTRLATLRISRAAAEQRAGRAGREFPGVAIRLWTAALHRGLPPFDRPEILEAELSGLRLDCAAWGTEPAGLPFADPPPAGALAAADALLGLLGAMADGRVTPVGRRMAALGAHPRLAAMMLAAATPAEAALAADIAALLEERDPLRSLDSRQPPPADIALRLALLADDDTRVAPGHSPALSPDHHPAAPGAALPPGLSADRGAVSRIRRAAAQYRRRLRATQPAAGDPAALLAAAFPDRVAQRRGEPGAFRLSGGGGARLPRADPLSAAALLAVGALETRAGSQIRLAAALDPQALPPCLAQALTETTEGGFDPVSGAVLSRRRRRLGALVLDDRTLPADPAHTAAALAAAVATRTDALPWTDAARQLQARTAWLRGLDPGVADLSDSALAASVQDWLAPALLGMSRLADLQRLDLAQLLRGMLGRDAGRLDRDLPTHLALPGGRAAVDYTQPLPIAAARAQTFYGLAETPRLAGGQVALQLALLSPAGRPVAITRDLRGFWAGSWAEIRREMRGRYPRHDWPEHPA